MNKDTFVNFLRRMHNNSLVL